MLTHKKSFQSAFSHKLVIISLCLHCTLLISAQTQVQPTQSIDKAEPGYSFVNNTNDLSDKTSNELSPLTKCTDSQSIQTATFSQQSKESMFKPLEWAVKTNLLLDGMGTLAVGFEFKTSDKTSLEIAGGYRLYDSKWPFGASNDSRQRFYYFQPEFRYWLDETFDGHFFGIHAHYAKYNIGGLTSLFSQSMRDNRYQGHLGGLGLSYGYNWKMNKHWSLEGTIGLGWSYMDYDKYLCQDCGEKLSSKSRHYFGPTKLGISIVYTIQK